jgi:DNA helicase-2/ATP-dependent DNA helicase PcrA
MEAFETIKDHIDNGHSYVLEAGAGSGKTYTLIQSMNYVLEKYSKDLKKNNKKIVCITYTNVAKNEIIDRLENNPLVIVSTIHEFLWGCVKSYNRQLLVQLDKLNTELNAKKPDKYQLGLIERINKVEYNDSSFQDFEIGQIGHDDVITISNLLFKNYELLTAIVAEKYPFIFVDEYQDTAVETVQALIDYLLIRNSGKVVLGFYGDSYQKIYDTGVGSLDEYVTTGKIKLVTKEENYRSSAKVVELLNGVRDNIVQKIPEKKKDPIVGSVRFVNCNNYPAPPVRGGKIEYEKSIVPVKNLNYDKVVGILEREGWNFGDGSEDKILIIANSRVADRGGFGALYKIFSVRFGEGAGDTLLKRQNPFSSFFLGTVDKKTSQEREIGVEHLISFWQAGDYNSVMRFLKRSGKLTDAGGVLLKTHRDKVLIKALIEELKVIRETKTVKDVFEFATTKKLVAVPKYISLFQERIQKDISEVDEDKKERHQRDITFYSDLMKLPYAEYMMLFKHTQDQTVFSTKHGTKGEEYRNVLVVIDDTNWKQKYNFENFISGEEDKADRELRTKNLFYVSCSRAKENLVVLSLSEMKPSAMAKIKIWFPVNSVLAISDIN